MADVQARCGELHPDVIRKLMDLQAIEPFVDPMHHGDGFLKPGVELRFGAHLWWIAGFYAQAVTGEVHGY